MKSRKKYIILLLALLAMAGAAIGGLALRNRYQRKHAYLPQLDIVYATVNGKNLTLNAFLPEPRYGPAPVVIDIHGGWWYGGKAVEIYDVLWESGLFRRRHIAVFSINHRLGEEGGFPDNIRDCRNAIRFLRKNAARFNIDPDRILLIGGSTGGHMSLMSAMVPDDFPDGGPTPGLEGVSARVSGGFSFCAPTDLLRLWSQGPDDTVTAPDGKVTFRGPDPNILPDSRPRLRGIFRGITPDTDEHKALYTLMSPIGHVRKDLPPLMVCDGGADPVIPGLQGKALCEKIQAIGGDATYWITPNGGHRSPEGAEFEKLFDTFVCRVLKITPVK